MHRLITIAAIVTLAFTQVGHALAQELTSDNDSNASQETVTAGLCEPYFKADSLVFVIEPSISQTVPGVDMQFLGKIKNTNTYPIVDADIWARVYQAKDNDDRNDDILLEQFAVAEGLTIGSDTDLPFSFNWHVPRTISGGSYYVLLSLKSSDSYEPIAFDAKSGISGNRGYFTVDNNVPSEVVTFKAETAKLGGDSYNWIDGAPVVQVTDGLSVSVEIENPSDSEKRVPLQWSQYAGDSSDESQLRYRTTKLVTLAAGEKRTLTYEIQPQSEGAVEVMVVTQEAEIKSMVPIRFIQKGHPTTGLLFGGLAGALFTAGGEQTVFNCVEHLEPSLASMYSLMYILKDEEGNVIHTSEQNLTETTSSEVVANTFTPDLPYGLATLQVSLKYNGVVVEQATAVYDCSVIDPTKCIDKEFANNIFMKYGTYLILGIVILLLVTALGLYAIRKRRSHIIAMLFAGLFFSTSFIGLSNVALASHSGSCVLGPEESMNDVDGFVDMRGAYECQPLNYIDPLHGGNPASTLNNRYADCGTLGEGDLSPDGACLSRIQFSPSSGPAWRCQLYVHECSNTYDIDLGCGAQDLWTGMNCVAGQEARTDCLPTERGWERSTQSTLSCSMNPFSYTGNRGVCVADATCTPPTNSCTWSYVDGNDITDLWGNVQSGCRLPGIKNLNQCAPGVADGDPAPPGTPMACKLGPCEKLHKVGPGCSLSATADLKINSSDGPLSVNKATALDISWDASNTSLSTCTLYGAGLPNGSVQVGQIGTLTIPASASDTYILSCGSAAGDSDQVVVTVTNQPPNAPTVTHPTGSASFGVDTTFTITGSDPDIDNVFYQVDWDMDGNYDETSATVPSGTGVSVIHNWLASGQQNFQARTVDAAGAVSTWTPHSINIGIPSAATVTLEASVNGGAWSTADQTVNSSDSVALRWTSSNATNCSGTGGGFTPSGASGSDNVNTPAANSSITFDITCTGPGGNGTDNLTVTTRQLPNLTVSQSQSPQYGVFDSINSTYSQITVYFLTQNLGGSDTTSLADYRFEFDFNNDGSYEYRVDRPNGIGLLTAVAGFDNDNETVAGPIPFGTHGVRITVDTGGAINETDEGDNVFTGTVSTAPPDPGLSITANPARLQNGQNTTINWTISNPYSMSCSVYGPGMVTQTFDPSSSASGNYSAGPINAKSEYTISCTTSGTTFTDTVIVDTEGVIEEI